MEMLKISPQEHDLQQSPNIDDGDSDGDIEDEDEDDDSYVYGTVHHLYS